jgi:hypothetical protein
VFVYFFHSDEQLSLFFKEKLKTLPSSPQLVASVCRLMYAYAFWLRRQPPLVAAAIQYVVGAAHALSQKDGGTGSAGSLAAGDAFKRICMECNAVVSVNVKSLEPVIAFVLGPNTNIAAGDCKLKSLALDTGIRFVDGLVILARALPAADDRNNCLQYIANAILTAINTCVTVYTKATSATTATATATATTAAAAVVTVNNAQSALVRHIKLLNAVLAGLGDANEQKAVKSTPTSGVLPVVTSYVMHRQT